MACASQEQAALEILRLSLDRSYDVAGRMIQRVHSVDDPEPMTVEVRWQHGVIRRTVMSPLSAAGIVSIDDGRNWRQIFPSKKEVVVQLSPRRHSANTDERIAAMRTNYEVRVTGSVTVAGRQGIAIEAKPTHDTMSIRRMVIDRERFVLLRDQTVDRDGKLRRSVETLVAEFSSETDWNASQTPDLSDFQTVRAPVTVRYTSGDNAGQEMRRLVGFSPRIADRLPYGFAVTAVEIIQSRPRSFVAVRLSDGFESITVFQWLPDADIKSAPYSWDESDGAVKDRHGVMCRAVGEVPRAALAQIVQSFVGVHGQAQRPSGNADPQTARFSF